MPTGASAWATASDHPPLSRGARLVCSGDRATTGCAAEIAVARASNRSSAAHLVQDRAATDATRQPLPGRNAHRHRGGPDRLGPVLEPIASVTEAPRDSPRSPLLSRRPLPYAVSGRARRETAPHVLREQVTVHTVRVRHLRPTEESS